MSALKHSPVVRLLHFLFFLVAPATLFAQMSRLIFEDEPQFVHETFFSYIYRIPADSVANVVYSGRIPDVQASWLQQPVCRVMYNREDSLVQSEYLSPGHYVAVRLVRNVLHFNFHRKTAMEPHIVDLGDIKLLELKDEDNRDVRNAIVTIKGKNIPFDYNMGGHVLHKFNNGDTIWVRRWEDIFFYTGQVHRRYNEIDYSSRNYPDYSNYRGYLVTNKPKYLPGDTVKFKAYLLQPHTGKPVTENMSISMESYDHEGRKAFNLIPGLNAKAPGVYFSEFVLGDSVKMDKVYTLKMQGLKSGRAMVQQFKTEDYLLDETFLSVRGEGYRQYQKGDSIHLYAYAHNCNNLPLLDGTVTVTLVPYGGHLRGKVADTLYHRTVPVSPAGETYIGCGTEVLPDSLSVPMLCLVRLAAANGETRDTSFQLYYTSKPYYIDVKQSGRTLTANLVKNKKNVKGEGWFLNPYDGSHKAPISYPAHISINEHAHWVNFTTDLKDSLADAYGYYIARDSLRMIEYYIGDTAYLQIINPQQAYVRYSVYKGNDYHSHGSVAADALLKFAAAEGETFTVMAKYKWLEQRDRTVTIAKYDKKIQIGMTKKDVVFPGQADSIRISLSTVDGAPVAKTNLTVFAFNSQFTENYVPTLPYGGVLRSGLRYLNPVRTFQGHDFVRNRTAQLNDRRWLTKCGADTMLFFRYCLMPEHGFTHLAYDRPEVSNSQIGIFLSRDWQFEKPVAIYIDERPVYYSQAHSTDHEAFFVNSGRHSVKIRTTDALYTIPSISIARSTKTNLYINLNAPGAELIKKEMPDTLTAEECAQLSPYFIYYLTEPEGHGKQYPIVFTQYPLQYQLQGGYRSVYLIGPFDPRDSIHFFHTLNTKKKFLPEKDFQYTFMPGMVRMERLGLCDQVGQRYHSSKYWPTVERKAIEPQLQEDKDLYPPQRYVHVQYEANSDRIRSGVRGVVKNDKNWPMAKTKIYLRNARKKIPVVYTARDGSFGMDAVPPGIYTVDVDCPGYITLRLNNVKVKKGKNTILNITLETNLKKSMRRPVNELNEVTVIAYKVPLIDRYSPGTTSTVTSETIDRMPSRSTNAMAATTAGVYQGNGGELNIQGGRNDQTIYYIDGVQVRGAQGINLPHAAYAVTEAYHSAKATETMQPNYNFLNSTQGQEFVDEFMNNMMQASGMRKNFSDYAIWEPNLWTDKNGNVSFRAVYPDNMTSWKTYVLAMNEKGFSGQTMKITRSFKPLSAELSIPRFLLYGDTVEAIGRISNYTSTAFSLRTSFMRQDREVKTKDLSVGKAAIELQRIEAPAANRLDTAMLPVSFSIATGNGYTDGEERIIPVFPVGITEDKGFFSALFSDTIIYSRPESGMFFTGNTTVSVDGSLVDVMLNEIENLKVYPHGCTEQLTTKLLAIHYEEEIKRLMQDSKLNNTKAKREILEKLVQAQNADGSFGWWRGNSNDYRITNYVLSTMHKANTDGWLSVILNRGFSFLRNNLDQMRDHDLITALSTLSAAHYPVNYSPYITRLDTTVNNLYDRFCLVRIKQEHDIAYAADLDSLVKLARRTRTGTHWSAHNGYDWYRNDLATTLVAYEVIKNDSTSRYMTNDILHYVIGKREHGYYGNTAESGLVLTHVLPDLLQKAGSKDKITQQTRLLITGSVNDTVTEFPKRYQLKNRKDQDFSFAKTGISTVYVSVMYQYFNPHPEARRDSFEVQTYFIKKGDTVAKLKQGDDVILRAVVTSKGPAEYVMIEIPIPAGCIQSGIKRSYLEAHRENYKERTLVFCNSLAPGTYTFDVPLEARYKGSYNINPAKAGMMYYAGEYGNTDVKRIVIE